MSQSNQQEQTEAKLLAYIEGELDDAGRAEIERHLEAHPNHRRMLLDLSQGRDFVRFLPKDSAPPELLETFQAQLERSVLLGDTATDSDPAPMRMGRWDWSNVRSAAAVLLLAAGLGVVVFVALPGRQPAVVLDDKVVTSTDGEGRPTGPDGSVAGVGTEAGSVAKLGAVSDNRADEADKSSGEGAVDHPLAMNRDGAADLPTAAAPAGSPARGPEVAKGGAPDPATPFGAAEGLAANPARELRKSTAGKAGTGMTELAAGASAMDAGQVARLKRIEDGSMDNVWRSVALNPAVQDAVQNGKNSQYVSSAFARNRRATSAKAIDADANLNKQFTAGTDRAAGARGAALDPTGASAAGGTTANAPLAVGLGYTAQPVYVVVASADPAEAQKQITEFLVANAISFDSVDRSAYQDGDAPDAPVSSNARGLNRAAAPTDLHEAPPPAADAAPTPVAMKSKMDAAAKPASVARAEDESTRPATGAPAGGGGGGAATGGRAADKNSADAKTMVAEPATSNAGIAGVAPSERAVQQATQANGQLRVPDDENRTASKDQSPAQAQQPAHPGIALQQVDRARLGGDAGQPIKELIIARGMNRRQAEVLRSNVHRPTEVQYANLYARQAQGAVQKQESLASNGAVREQQQRLATAGEGRLAEAPAGPDARPAARPDGLAHAGEKSAVAPAVTAEPLVAAPPPATSPVAAAATPPTAAGARGRPPASKDGPVAMTPPPAPAPTAPHPRPTPTPALPSARPAAPSAPTAMEPVIRRGEILRIAWMDDQASGQQQVFERQVSEQGTVQVPTLGDIRCAGQTPSETERQIREALAKSKAAAPAGAAETSVSVRKLSVTALADGPAAAGQGAAPAGPTTPARPGPSQTPAPAAPAAAVVPNAPAPALDAAVGSNVGASLSAAATDPGSAPMVQVQQAVASTRPATSPVVESAEAVDDEPVDVVIVVQRTAAVASDIAGAVTAVPAPATQPTAAPSEVREASKEGKLSK